MIVCKSLEEKLNISLKKKKNPGVSEISFVNQNQSRDHVIKNSNETKKKKDCRFYFPSCWCEILKIFRPVKGWH